MALLFSATASRHRGSPQGLREKLLQLQALNIPGMGTWLKHYIGQGCPPLHHSGRFRLAYHPHYRVIAQDYVQFLFLLLAIYPLAQEQRTAVVAIDGRCASGKTCLASMIAQIFPCNVFHMDDFYLPAPLRTPERMAVPGGNIDHERFLREVLAPVRRGEEVRFRPYDCASGQAGAQVTVPHRPLNIVEGSYSQQPALADGYDLKVFLTCTPEEQRRRLLHREGEEGLLAFERRWIPMEERYFAALHVEEESDLSVDTTDFSGPGEAR